MEEIIDIDEDDLLLAVVCRDELLFLLMFWEDSFDLEPSVEQKMLACDRSKRVLACTGRKVAKTLVVEAKIVQLGINHIQKGTGITEALLFAPQDNQLSPIVDRVASRIKRTPFFDALVEDIRRGEGQKITFFSGLVWYCRIEGVSGSDRNMVGLRAAFILGDEMAFGNCLPRGTQVQVWPGKSKPIEDIEIGDYVYGWGDSGLSPTRVMNKFTGGKKKILSISTGTRKIRTSEDHGFLVAERTKLGKRGAPSKSRSEWGLSWKKASDLKKSDFIVISKSLPDLGDYSITKEMCGLIGIFLGDGSFAEQHLRSGLGNGRMGRIDIATFPGDKAFDLLIECVSAVSDHKPSIRKTSTTINDSALSQWLCEKLGRLDARTKVIPSWCFDLSVELKEEIIKGLLLTDGYFNNKTGGDGSWYFESASKNLAHDLRGLAVSCGWRVSNVYHQKSKNPFWKKTGRGKEDVESWTFTLRKITGAHGERNYTWDFPMGLNRIELPEGLAIDRIRGIEDDGTEETFDIETECHNFLAEWVLVHNSVNHNSRIQTALPDAKWWYSGVPNGVRNTPFYQLDQTSLGKGWSRHKYSTFINPIYAEQSARDSLTDAYGGEHTQGYITQVLGEWGDETISSFPPNSMSVGHQPYFIRELTTALKNSDTAIAVSLGFPAIRADRFCIGWDYGYSPDPSVLIIAYQRDSKTDWLCYARINMRQVALPIQARVVKYLYTNIMQGNLGAISCDSADAIQTLQGADPALADRFFAVKPGGMMPMIDETGQVVMEMNEKTQKLEVAMIRVKQYLTEKFRGFMINTLLDLPGIHLTLGDDADMIEELAATTESKTQGGYTVYYGPPDRNSSGKMNDHCTDAGRHLSDAIIRSVDKESESDLDLINAMGWIGEGKKGWIASW